VALDPGLFTLEQPKGATVIDHAEWDVEWERRYAKGWGRAMLGDHEVVLRDMQVTTTGNVFAVWGGTSANVTRYEAPGRPTRYSVDAELTDSLGTVYCTTCSAHGAARASSSSPSCHRHPDRPGMSLWCSNAPAPGPTRRDPSASA